MFLPGKFHGQRNMAGYIPWGFKESYITEHAHACTGKYMWSWFIRAEKTEEKVVGTNAEVGKPEVELINC